MKISQMIHVIENDLKRSVAKGKDKVFVYPFKMVYKKKTYSIIHEEDKLVPIFSSKDEHEACEKMIDLVKKNIATASSEETGVEADIEVNAV